MEQAARGGGLDGADPVLRVLAQAVAFKQTDDGQRQQDDQRQVAGFHEPGADGGKHLVDRETRRQRRADGRDDHDLHGIEAQHEARHDDGHAYQRPEIDVRQHVDFLMKHPLAAAAPPLEPAVQWWQSLSFVQRNYVFVLQN